jgi:hypothetical protein
MTTRPTIESLEKLLLSKCYYYAYIDDTGLRGTIDMSAFKQGKPVTKYYGEENGVKGRLYDSMWTADFNINFRRKPEDRISAKSIELPTLQLYDADKGTNFVKGTGMRILYLLKDDGVIGSKNKEVIGTVVTVNNGGNDNKIVYEAFKNLSNKKQRLTDGAGSDEYDPELESEPKSEPESESEREPDTEYITDEYKVYINNVDIDSDSQSKRLCKIMVQLFLLNANVSAGENLSFYLTNAGGQISCRCYTNAFKECGYKVFGYIEEPRGRHDTITIKKEMTVDLCKTFYSDPDDNDAYIQMGFVYSGISGGKRSGSKSKNKKTKKSGKIKTKKSRKNKTRKSRKNKTIKK